MPTCRSCGTAAATADLVRHEFDGRLFVHCPTCRAAMGQYRTTRPAVDTHSTART